VTCENSSFPLPW